MAFYKMTYFALHFELLVYYFQSHLKDKIQEINARISSFLGPDLKNRDSVAPGKDNSDRESLVPGVALVTGEATVLAEVENKKDLNTPVHTNR